MRKPIDLIKELETEAPKFLVVALVVVFEHSTSVFDEQIKTMPIFANDEDRVDRLTKAIGEGGVPIGFMGLVKTGNHAGTFYTRPLVPEVHTDPAVQDHYDQDHFDKLIDLAAREFNLLPKSTQRSRDWID